MELETTSGSCAFLASYDKFAKDLAPAAAALHSLSPPASSPYILPQTPLSPEIKEEYEEEEEEMETSKRCSTQKIKTDNRSNHLDEFGMDWERELEELARDHDLGLNTNGRQKEELLALTVREFNRRVQQLALSEETVEYLKQIRRRRKNRLAAIRSRSRKDIKVTDLQKQVDQLLEENKRQKGLIRTLQSRLSSFEKKF